MSLYPSLEDMKVDNMVRAQIAHQSPPPPYNPAAMAVAPVGPAGVYPALGEYMGLELSQAMIAENMPEYIMPQVNVIKQNSELYSSQQSSKEPQKIEFEFSIVYFRARISIPFH